MLKIKPNCENCNIDLPNGDPKAMICSYECTFCTDCVDGVLEGVCPNCGGAFVARPKRVERPWRDGVSAAHQLPSAERIIKPVDVGAHTEFAAFVKNNSNESR